tara:strand:+ start:618 stop:773 length:156 start_codon:yes stop_codon:yes gene_type:complete
VESRRQLTGAAAALKAAEKRLNKALIRRAAKSAKEKEESLLGPLNSISLSV